jgi:hypothetical protein
VTRDSHEREAARSQSRGRKDGRPFTRSRETLRDASTRVWHDLWLDKVEAVAKVVRPARSEWATYRFVVIRLRPTRQSLTHSEAGWGSQGVHGAPACALAARRGLHTSEGVLPAIARRCLGLSVASGRPIAATSQSGADTTRTPPSTGAYVTGADPHRST